MIAPAHDSHRPDFVRGPHPAARRSWRAEPLGATSGHLRAESQRDQRAAEGRRAGHHRRRQEHVASSLGLQLPRGGLRCLHDAGQRRDATSLLRLGRQVAGRRTGEYRTPTDEQVSGGSRLGRRSGPHVPGSGASPGLDPCRRLRRSGAGTTGVARGTGNSLSALRVHDLRLLRRGVSTVHQGRTDTTRG